MPRINAPTVGEHRAAQRHALLNAAREVLAEGTADIPSFGEIAARAGLARSSVYQYFNSRQDLLDALVEDSFPRWSQKLTEAMAEADGPAGRILAYVDANLTLAADGEHAIAASLSQIASGPKFDEKSRALHADLVTPLLHTLQELSAGDPAGMAELINAVVHTGVRQIERGTDPDLVRRNAAALVAPYAADPS